MTYRHCASSNKCGTVPVRIVVAVARIGRLTGRAATPLITKSSL
jgi:hypothetical protein